MFKSRNIFPIFLKNSSFRIEYLMQCIKYSILKDMIIEENDNLRPDRFMVRAFGAQSYPPPPSVCLKKNARNATYFGRILLTDVSR